MLGVVSSHVFLRQRLQPGVLDALSKTDATGSTAVTSTSAQGIEIFCARQHFDYASRQAVSEIAQWFRGSTVKLHSMHMPLYADTEMGRSGAPAVNVVHPEKSRRIDSMDEIKRALEVAEQIPFKFLVLHLGERQDTWSPRTLEHALTAIEHLRAFARPLGVTLVLENLVNEVTAPERLVEILKTGHFQDSVGVCFDIGHANITVGVESALNTLLPHIRTTHIHDNLGDRDAHLWPGDGNIAWAEVMPQLKAAPHEPACVLEVHYEFGEDAAMVSRKAADTFGKLAV